MKKCNKCLAEKAYAEFRNRPGGKFRSICKECDAAYAKERWVDQRDRLLKQNKNYREKNGDDLANKRRVRLGQKKRSGVDIEKLKENHRRCHKKYVERYPHKIKAHVEVRKALRKGVLMKPKECEKCLQEKRLEGHHEDYDKPLEVIWLCKKCHLKIHGRCYK